MKIVKSPQSLQEEEKEKKSHWGHCIRVHPHLWPLQTASDDGVMLWAAKLVDPLVAREP